jgi:hypothetical protein
MTIIRRVSEPVRAARLTLRGAAREPSAAALTGGAACSFN